MSEVKRIVCLANSRKLSGRCIAGRERTTTKPVGNWIRPVSAREHGEVSEYERQYEDGSDPYVLDLIDIPVKRPKPEGCQSENWLLDPKYYWEKAGIFPVNELSSLTDPTESLWIDDFSTNHGRNDRIPMSVESEIDSSLRLVEVENLVLKVFAPGEAFGNSKRRVQGQFEHAGQSYALWITDPVYEKKYLAGNDGSYRIDKCYLTISLGEPYNNAIYKLIAAIIEPDGR